MEETFREKVRSFLRDCLPPNVAAKVKAGQRLAYLLLEVEQARPAVINTATDMDADHLTGERALSAAKYSIGRIGTWVAEEIIQMNGGIDMTWELPQAHYAKRLVMIDH